MQSIYTLQLHVVPRGYDDLLGVLVAVSLDSRKLSVTTEENIIEDNGVVGAVVKPRHLCFLRQANAKELVDRAAIFAVLLASLFVGQTNKTLWPLCFICSQA